MKAWMLNTKWQHKKTNFIHSLSFIVITNDNADPIEVLKKEVDLSGMTYLNGDIEAIDAPYVYSMLQ